MCILDACFQLAKLISGDVFLWFGGEASPPPRGATWNSSCKAGCAAVVAAGVVLYLPNNSRSAQLVMSGWQLDK